MKKYLITILIMMTICTLLFTACTTSASWTNQNTETKNSDVNVAKVNGSEKYIVYAALNASGNLITRPAEGEPEATEAYAVVGYTGLVSELVIPAKYNNKNVTKVLVASPYSDYYCYSNGSAYSDNDARLANNPVVKSIVFGANVVFVGAGVCAGMVNLTTVHFDHVQAGITHTNAFLGISPAPTITYKT